MKYRDHIKRLARRYLELGDTPRQAMKEACAFHANVSLIWGKPVPAAHALWSEQRVERFRMGIYAPPR